jgi:hypothetical protein
VDDFAELIVKQGRGAYMYSTDVARAFRQLPECPADWPLTGCCTPDGYFIDISLPFGLRWAAACCQWVTNVVSHILQRHDLPVLNYIDDFGGVCASKQRAEQGFKLLRDTLAELGIEEAVHKATAPQKSMIWLGFLFKSEDMTVSLPKAKLEDTLRLVQNWLLKDRATLSQLRSLLGKLFHVAQVCKPARLFVGRMLATLRACPTSGYIALQNDFKQDLSWFRRYLPTCNGIFMLQPAQPHPVHVWVDSCTSGCGGMALDECYHAVYPPSVQARGLEICHLEMLNSLIALRLWATRLTEQVVHLHCDSMVAIAVLQMGAGRDQFLLACAREMWLICATHNITLKPLHTPGELLTHSVDALSRMHTGQVYSNRVDKLLASKHLSMVTVPQHCFTLDMQL